MKILILGATGMVGRSLFRKLESDSNFEVMGTTTGNFLEKKLIRFDWPKDSLTQLIESFLPTVVINLAAKLNFKSLDTDQVASQRTFEINADLLLALSKVADVVRIVHISTDGVFRGDNPPYVEDSPADGKGVYAESKIKGEENLVKGNIFRSSIIGRSPNPMVSIPNLLLRQPRAGIMEIPNNEYWNGVTSFALAEFIHALLVHNLLDATGKIQHVIPKYPLNKLELFREISIAVGRSDLTFIPTIADFPSSRILSTLNPEYLTKVWGHTSFGHIPTIQEMIQKSDLINVCSVV